MKTEEITHSLFKFKFTLHISKNGNCYCPVCGDEAQNYKWRPYDKLGMPSYDICDTCIYEYGYNDVDEVPYPNTWKTYREEWLNNKIENGKKLNLLDKRKLLENIGL